jgi:hypothetical protein
MKKSLLRMKCQRIMNYYYNKGLFMTYGAIGLFVTSVELLVELILTVVRTCLPLFAYYTLLQMNEKAQSLTTLPNLTSEKSTYMVVAPNLILVSINGKQLKNDVKKYKKESDKVLPPIITLLKILAYVSVIIMCIYLLIKHNIGV